MVRNILIAIKTHDQSLPFHSNSTSLSKPKIKHILYRIPSGILYGIHPLDNLQYELIHLRTSNLNSNLH